MAQIKLYGSQYTNNIVINNALVYCVVIRLELFRVTMPPPPPTLPHFHHTAKSTRRYVIKHTFLNCY